MTCDFGAVAAGTTETLVLMLSADQDDDVDDEDLVNNAFVEDSSTVDPDVTDNGATETVRIIDDD